MASAMASRLVQALANRGAQGPQGPMMPQPSPGGGEDQGQPSLTAKVSGELSDIQGADPQALRGLLMQIKQQLVALIPHTAFRTPGVTKHVSKAMDNVSAALTEVEKVMQTTSAVGATPIGMSAVQSAAGATGPGV